MSATLRAVARTKLKGTIGQIVEITLEEHSTADNQPKTFPAQTVEIVHDTDTVSNSVDGRISIGRHPSKILWVEGSATDLANITNVKITGNKGQLLIDGELNTFRGVSDTAHGVEFYVLIDQ